jgi:prepilin-type N-terminal cleavage/methylation domain-containing protein
MRAGPLTSAEHPRTARRRVSGRGVTLLEMMIVVAIIAIITGISFPSIAAGLDNLRIGASAAGVAGFLDAAAANADRRQAVVEIVISRPDNALLLRSTDPALAKRFDLPEGTRIERVLPEVPSIGRDQARRFVIYPGGAVPAIGVEIVNERGSRRLVRIHPITGVAVIEKPA